MTRHFLGGKGFGNILYSSIPGILTLSPSWQVANDLRVMHDIDNSVHEFKNPYYLWCAYITNN